jgi:outer membrane biosynthesis protein TonB
VPPSVLASSATIEKTETPVTDSDSEAAALAVTTITEAAPPPQPAASITPTPAAKAPPPSVPEPAAKTPPAPTPAKKTPEKVAKAAPAPVPASKPAKSAPAPKKQPPSRPSKPRTRAEKVAALLESAQENFRADRLTTPKKRNALRDYLTALAIDKNSAAAHQGIENIVRQYVTRARTAIEARRFETANDNLHQARFVLDAMKLRRWPQATYGALFSEYRDANQLLAASQ